MLTDGLLYFQNDNNTWTKYKWENVNVEKLQCIGLNVLYCLNVESIVHVQPMARLINLRIKFDYVSLN